MMRDYLNKIRTYFITGVAVILPTFLTIIILKWLTGKINRWFLEPFIGLVRPYTDSFFVIFFLKLILFCGILIIVILCGVATRLIFVRKFFGWGERLFIKAPLISKIYTVIKEISSAFLGKKKGLFKRVVVVEFPREGMFAIGFITREHIDRGVITKLVDDDLASVFIPTAPNPTSGAFVLVPKKDLIEVDITVEEALKLIISCGAVSAYSRKHQ